MMHISKEQEPLYLELKEVEKEMRSNAEQAKMFENSLMILNRTIKKNDLTVKQLEKLPNDRAVYVPLGRAFLRKSRDAAMKQFSLANDKLTESLKDMEKNQKVFSDKANEKYQILKTGTEKLMKK